MSKNTFPHNLTEIDALTRGDHYYIDGDDQCLFLGEYTARRGFAHSDTNSLIINLKKRPDTRGTPQWKWKGNAIRKAITALRNALPDDWTATATFVPIPPSKAKSDPLYDDRMTKILEGCGDGLDVRELILQNISTQPVHESDDRMTPAELTAIYTIDQELVRPPPTNIVVCDDMLTTGAHFKAAKSLLRLQFPGCPIVGVFIARRAPEADEFDDLGNFLMLDDELDL